MDLDAVSRLLSLTSHELRSPLGVMRGYLKLLEQQAGGLTDQQRHVIAASLKASDRMTELLGEMSALAHLQRGETQVDRRATTLAAVVDDFLEQRVVVGDHATQLRRGDVPSVEILADRVLLAPALATLAAATIAARPREADLMASGRVESHDKAFVRLEIAAISATTSDIADVPLNLLRGGLGLRLPLAAAIIDAHDGRIGELQQGGRLAGMVVWLPVAAGK